MHPVSVPVPLFLVLVDLRGVKSTTEILASLQSCFPFPSSPAQQGVVRLLGETNARITEAALRAMTAGDAVAVGRLMTEAQAEFDAHAAPVCPGQLTAPLLHKLLALPSIQPLVLGGKGVGAGGDGTAQLLCRTREDQAAVCRLIEAELHMPCLTVDIAPSTAVLTAVGAAQAPRRGSAGRLPASPPSPLATRRSARCGLHPALLPRLQGRPDGAACVPPPLPRPRLREPRPTRFPPRAVPILEPDGETAVPAIVRAVAELVDAGVQRVLIVVQPEDEVYYARLFKERLRPGHSHRLPGTAALAAETRVLELGRCVSFVPQAQQEGLGHAVLCAREAVGDAPFIVYLPDQVYKSHDAAGRSCLRQLLDAFQRGSARSVIGLERSSVSKAPRTACATGLWEDGGVPAAAAGAPAEPPARTSLSVTDIAEKPTVEDARARFGLPALGPDTVLTACVGRARVCAVGGSDHPPPRPPCAALACTLSPPRSSRSSSAWSRTACASRAAPSASRPRSTSCAARRGSRAPSSAASASTLRTRPRTRALSRPSSPPPPPPLSSHSVRYVPSCV